MIDVILLEDEPVLRQELGEFLDEEGYRATRTASLAEFEQHFQAHRHHLAVIDIGLPDGSGLQLIQRLRQSGHPLGIVIFSAKGTTADKIGGLDIGADHYLSKGCDLEELSATLAALARRMELRQEKTLWQLEVGPRRLLTPNAVHIPLSQQDMLVLHSLMQQAGNNVSREQIVQDLGADFMHYDQRRLDSQMRRLRRKVETLSGQPLPIKTLRNSGYCFYERSRVCG
ncbi:response regulator transcription factor [Pseudomonas sp. ABC1]|uniref:response regulator transcription factor n=1 Tax=Pseudomonas sp. ABC1 TaxID=2748080 RepID=UPI0015C40CEC|nr:response regulator transcription factor [Pseudomonas sp. ABC1]QLF92873.1 response regulator transcription factor [Pseudomonas sp. ABC1]